MFCQAGDFLEWEASIYEGDRLVEDGGVRVGTFVGTIRRRAGGQ
jgi:hypothetical protein